MKKLEKKVLSTINATIVKKIPVIVENIKTNDKFEYASLTDVGKALGLPKGAVIQALLNNRLLKKTYLISKKYKT